MENPFQNPNPALNKDHIVKIERAFELLKSEDWEIIAWQSMSDEASTHASPRPHIKEVTAEADAYVVTLAFRLSEETVRYYRQDPAYHAVEGQPAYRFPVAGLVVEATSSRKTKLDSIVIRDASGTEVIRARLWNAHGPRCMCGTERCGMLPREPVPRPKTNLGDKLADALNLKR